MLSDVRDRKLVQWVVAYAVAAWAVVEVLDVVGEGFGWSPTPLRIAIILAVAGAPVVVVLGWFHGEKGRQRVAPLEAFLLAVLAVTGVVAIVAFGTPPLSSHADAVGLGIRSAPAQLDSTRYVVLPFRRQGAVTEHLHEDLLLHDALARWRGIQLVDLFQVQDLAKDGAESLDLHQAAGIAADFGAGRYIRGEVSALPSGFRIRVALHDTRSALILADTTFTVGERSAFDDSAAARLAAHLLFRGAGIQAGEDEDPATTSFAARLAFVNGQEALLHWDLERAAALFERALREDPGYARAHLWRAQVGNWNDAHPRTLLAAAEIAAAAGERLTGRERLLAHALVALAREDYSAACTAYEALRRSNELDFAAWYGLGECRRHDAAVVRDPASPSGWNFRSSYYPAVEAYRRAFEVLPLAHLGFRSGTFERVSRLLFVSSDQMRQGRAVAPDTGVFWARPALRRDTLAFVPFRLKDVSAGVEGSRPDSHWEAVERQRSVFASLAAGWVAAFPTSVPALQAAALARELTGDPEALVLLRRARSWSTERRHKLEIMAEEIRLLVKSGDLDLLARAAALADTLLAAPAGAVEDRHLAEVAALTGRAITAATHARSAARAQPWSVMIPAVVTRAAEALLAYAALGGPADSLRAAEREVVAGIENRLPSEAREGVAHFLLDRAASLAFTSDALTSTARLAANTNYPVLRAQGLLAAGDSAGAIAVIRTAQQPRARLRPNEIAVETIFAEAWVLAAAGAPEEAARLLDRTLDGLRWCEPGYLGDVAKASALVRAMALRAELADFLGEPDTARRWATAVSLLWARSDPHLAPVLNRMRTIAASPVPLHPRP